MKTQKIILIFTALFAACLGLSGCRNVSVAYDEDYVKTAKRTIEIVEGNPTADGVKQASDYLKSQKSTLMADYAAHSKNHPDGKSPIDEVITANHVEYQHKLSMLSGKYPAIKKELSDLEYELSWIYLEKPLIAKSTPVPMATPSGDAILVTKLAKDCGSGPKCKGKEYTVYGYADKPIGPSVMLANDTDDGDNVFAFMSKDSASFADLNQGWYKLTLVCKYDFGGIPKMEECRLVKGESVPAGKKAAELEKEGK